jgi:hypothetical protein
MTAAAGVIALLALVATVASLAYLHLAPTGLSPVRNAVSQYGITPFRVGYRAATLAFALAGVALAVGIDHALGAPARGVVIALAIFAAARAAISWFPMDAPGSQGTATGRRHGLLALAAFAAVAFGALRLGSVLEHAGRWHALATTSSVLGAVMLACLVGMGLARSHPGLRERFGLIERGFYLSAIAWFAVFAVAAATTG